MSSAQSKAKFVGEVERVHEDVNKSVAQVQGQLESKNGEKAKIHIRTYG